MSDLKLHSASLYITPGAADALQAKGIGGIIGVLLARHFTGDWGNLDAEDRAANDASVADGSRVLSAYVAAGIKVWIITEAADDHGVRAATTILLPEEY
jgi:hypothetical protein